MREQRYERVSHNDTDSPSTPDEERTPAPIPSSPPPSFRSRASSPASRHPRTSSLISGDVDRTLADTFDDGAGSDDDEEAGSDDRQRLMRPTGTTASSGSSRNDAAPGFERRITELPRFDTTPAPPTTTRARPNNGATAPMPFSSSNDGVFANLNAKPERGEKLEEHPPSYEQAAADATPPYWETTILAPGMISDEVYVDGLPVGSLFSFAWNGVISMSFQLVGFLLTYLLHTTHAAKNGSRAGLGITLVQYGFYVKGSSSRRGGGEPPAAAAQYEQPQDPNSHSFDPSAVASSGAAAAVAAGQAGNAVATGHGGGFPASEWFAYMLMIAGWFVLIRAVTDFIKARRHEQLVLRSPDRGLNVPVVAEGEASETVV